MTLLKTKNDEGSCPYGMLNQVTAKIDFYIVFTVRITLTSMQQQQVAIMSCLCVGVAEARTIY